VPTVTFQPAGVSIEVPEGTTVFFAAAKAEVAIPSQCGGRCACALCKVRIAEGSELVSPMKWDEEGHMGNAFYLTRERLSCQTRVYGDVEIEVEEAQIKEKARGRYIPYSLIRKREKMEADEELRRVRAGAREGHHDGGRKPRRKPRRPPEGDRPRAEGDRPRAEGDRPRPEGDRPRAEGDRPRAEGDRPRAEGDRPRAEGDRPARSRPRPESKADGAEQRPDEERPKKRRRRRRRRNPGAPRPGDHKPPPGKADPSS
jgi:ferredoxin